MSDSTVPMNDAENRAVRPRDIETPPRAMPEKFDLEFLKSRTKEVCLNPKGCWDELQQERANVRSMYLGYIAIVAAVPVVCEFLRMITIGRSLPLIGTFRWPFFSGLIYSVAQYALSLAMIYVTALIAAKLADRFGGRTDTISALKLVAYSATPAWLAGVLSLVPFLSVFGIVAGIYSIYLLYHGTPTMTGVSGAKRLPYLAVTIVCAMIAGVVMFAVASAVIPTPYASAIGGTDQPRIPNSLNVDPEKLQKTLEELQRTLPQN